MIVLQIKQISLNIGQQSASNIYEKIRALPSFGNAQQEEFETFFFEIPNNQLDDKVSNGEDDEEEGEQINEKFVQLRNLAKSEFQKLCLKFFMT